MVEILINNKPFVPFLEKELIEVESWQINKNNFPIAGCFEVNTIIVESTILVLINEIIFKR